MLKRPKGGKIFADDEHLLRGRSSLCNYKECMRKGYVLTALAIFFICVLFICSFNFFQQPEDSTFVDGSQLSSFTYFPWLALDSQAATDDDRYVSDGEPLTVGSEFLEPFDDGRLVASEGVARGCDWNAELKVYMYDLPPEFHYGLIAGYEIEQGQNWPANGSAIPEYPGGLNMQHSPEYWLTSDLLTSNKADRNVACTAFRVDDWRDADLVFVPFFASLSYNRYGKASEERRLTEPLMKDENDELQLKLVEFLHNHPAWQASDGRDHVIVIHHPNSMSRVRDQLRNALYVVSDFGRYDNETANINKDVVAPYMHVIPTYSHDASAFDTRLTLLFFQGAIVRKDGGQIRHELYLLLKDEPGVHFTTGNTGLDGFASAAAGMRSSKFCLNMAGDTPSSNRLFDSIVSHCVPVIISDEIELPFEDDLDYSQFCIFVNSSDALRPGFVIDMLRNVTSNQWTELWENLVQVEHHFEYQHPTKPSDAVNMLWKAIARRLPSINFNIHRRSRYKATDASISPSSQLRKL
ncbi:hypothetical protein M758_9G145200 [Ceratodon purpureus]|uniref:Exostosin GT47 domain-containing protein n=1 Tax=Ceratodon purpureus TaxID=3225 RepID=A0A8T0GZW5_CERPU|nr:hypothetical protein KC19_9G147600 [Ceratodon purpureus]KAG0606494.1 hypothetical protein M758_9G145200 [Ceratodon purpureus]